MAESLFGFDEKAAARILGVTPRTLRRWRQLGQIGYHRTPGGRIRYTMDQLIDAQRAARVNVGAGRACPPLAA